MKLYEKLKLTIKYFRSLENSEKAQKTSDLKIRPDAVAFLTSPYPVLPSEIDNSPETVQGKTAY